VCLLFVGVFFVVFGFWCLVLLCCGVWFVFVVCGGVLVGLGVCVCMCGLVVGFVVVGVFGLCFCFLWWLVF
jgi:hypothetical protein